MASPELLDYLADDDAYERINDAIGELVLPEAYCPYWPTAKQEHFLMQDALEVFFGGAAGPGKSWGLFMAGLQYVETEGYHGILLRPTLTEFEQPGALIEVSHDWLDGTDAHWNGTDREWRFPSKATLRFGYLSAPGHLRRYKGPSYSFVGFDELTGFHEWAYRAMFRVLRQAKGTLEGVPLRMRAASNPGDVGHTWVKDRFINPETRDEDAVYVRATIHDNPYLDYDTYVNTVLIHLSPVDRERLIRGDWDVMEEGGKFRRESFVVVDADEAPRPIKQVRYWDLAASEPTPAYPNPDWTVGLLLSVDDDKAFTIRDINRFRKADAKVEEEARTTAREDGRAVQIYIEQEPGASGKLVLGHWKRDVLSGFPVYAGHTRGGDKEVRARPVAAAAANGLVRIVRGRNMREFLDEAAIFPNGEHDDAIDALSGAHNALTKTRPGTAPRSSVARGRLPGVQAAGQTPGVPRRR